MKYFTFIQDKVLRATTSFWKADELEGTQESQTATQTGVLQRPTSAPRHLLLQYYSNLCSTAGADRGLELRKFLPESCVATHPDQGLGMNHHTLSYISSSRLEFCSHTSACVFLLPLEGRGFPCLPSAPARCSWHRPGGSSELVPAPPLDATCCSFPGLSSALSCCLAAALHDTCKNGRVREALNLCTWILEDGGAGSHTCINSGNQTKRSFSGFQCGNRNLHSCPAHVLLGELKTEDAEIFNT